MDFTGEQLRAIDISKLGQDACIVAGPGSGKTTVLVERYRQLIAQGVEPAEILAITFTEKAAANMRDRLSREFASSPELLRKLTRAYVSTIHGFCSRLLRGNATAAGVDPDFAILDEQVAVLEQTRCVREALDAFVETEPAAAAALLTATGGADLERQIPGIYDAMRAAGVRPEDLRQAEFGEQAASSAPSLSSVLEAADLYLRGFPPHINAAQRTARDNALEWVTRTRAAQGASELLPLLLQFPKAFSLKSTNSAKEAIRTARVDAERLAAHLLDEAHREHKELLIRIFEDFDRLYRAGKQALAALDFNDLEFHAVRLLEENPEIRGEVNEQFRLVMIDEFQDTSAQQSRLVNLIRAPGRFYAVGDLNQSIYSFRHASPKVFEGYSRSVMESQAHHEQLVENWRSREPVLLATQLIVHEAEGIVQRALLPARQLPARNHACIELLILEREDEEDDYALEAAWVSHRILDLRGALRIGEDSRAARFSDFALLVRNTAVLEPYLNAFQRAGIDYNLNRRSGFFETREARDLLHLCRVIHNPRDEVSTLAVLRSDFAGVSDEGLLRLKTPNRNLGEALLHFESLALSAEDAERLRRFVTQLAQWRASAGALPLDRLVLRALDAMGVVWDAQTTRGGNIEKFLTIARSHREMTLADFIAYAESLRKSNPREADAPIDETRDAVQIMTTHAAKGLEFPVVILAAMDKGIDSGDQAVLNFTPEQGLGVKWAVSDYAETCPGWVHTLNRDKLKVTEEGEANRLLYVALTRAQEHLILAWSQKKNERKNWAKLVTKALDLGETPFSQQASLRTYQAPNGRSFEARLIRTGEQPPPSVADSGTDGAIAAQVLQPPRLLDATEPNTTATALAEFASCPRKYYLSSFLGFDGVVPRPRTALDGSHSAARASDIGTQVHQLLANVPPTAPDLEALRLAKVFDDSPLGRRSARAHNAYAEWDFVFAREPLILRGTIDLWFEDPQGLTLVDYKTDSVTPERAAERALDYALQLQVYALALEKATGKLPGQAWLHFLRPDIALPIPLEAAAETVAGVARRLAAAQQSLDFPLNVGAHCRRCEFFRGLCPAKVG